MGDNMAEDTRGLSATMLERNLEFRRFSDRMKTLRRVFAVKSKLDGTLRVIELPSDDREFVEEDLKREWLNCCFREYLERRQLFEKRFRNRTQLILCILAFLVPFLAALWYMWPLWRVLFDVEADTHRKVLEVSPTATTAEITRAYRAMMKRWHPDHNPNCGPFCREKVEAVKVAYNVLLSRGEHRTTLANDYQESLSTLRSFLAFEGLQMSGEAAMNIFAILQRLFPCSARRGVTLRMACSVATLVFCMLYEMLFASGLNISTVIQFSYYILSVAKASAQQQVMEDLQRKSYFDVILDAALLLGCATAANITVWWREGAALTIENLFRMLYGSVYVLWFLNKFAPNVHDNFVMRKYSLPLTYIDMKKMRFSWARFAASQLMFLVGDLFVFTCRISSSHRVVVYVAHFVSLCQFWMLPWDPPVARGGASAEGTTYRVEEPIAPTGASASASVAQSAGAKSIQSAQQIKYVESYITKEELNLFVDLDEEDVGWMDIVSTKYHSLLLSLGEKHSRQRDLLGASVCLAPSADLQEIVLLAFVPAAGTSMPVLKEEYHVLGKVRDPEMSRLLAVECGPKAMFPLRSKSQWSLDLARVEYSKLLGPKAPWTTSQLWRKGRLGTQSSVWRAQVMMACAMMGVAFLCAFVAPSAEYTVRCSKGIDSSLRPQLFARFLDTLPPNHVVNALSAGLLTMSQIPLCTLDWWDAGATLGFVRG